MVSSDVVLTTQTSRSLLSRFKTVIRSNLILVTIVSVAAVVWVLVFNQAMSDFLLGTNWNGSGYIPIFGFTVPVEFEGWSDYSYYYLTWGNRFLEGYSPYTDAFNNVAPDQYVPYFFPPLYLYLCALGNSLPFGQFGIAILLCLFGYFTAVPVYGIAKYLSQNKRVGEIAVASYLLNPLVLYHTVYEWLNPAPFVFFMLLSFYLMMKRHRTVGTLAMVTAVLFKQTAVFMALPLVAYLLRMPPSKELADTASETSEEYELVVGDNLDLRGFFKVGLIVVVYVAIISVPYIFDIENYVYYLLVKPGMTLLRDLTTLPESNFPVTFAVPFIVIHTPTPIIQFFNLATAYSILLLISMVVIFIPMLSEVKDDRNLRDYWRRILFLSLLLLLAVHIFSPRGIYKYYCMALIPFFSIVNSERMIAHGTKKLRASFPMVLNPLLITLVILIPNRYIYLGFLVLVLLSYILHEHFGIVYNEFNLSFKYILQNLRFRFSSITSHFSES